MKLLDVKTAEGRKVFEEKGYSVFSYDREALKEKTKTSPVWIHFGAGNIFRGFIAGLQEKLLNAGESSTGIIAADTFDYDMHQVVAGALAVVRRELGQ